eukprot:585454-Pleurochrysis_carterae.AAC.1
MSPSGHEGRLSPGEIAWDFGELATAAEAAAEMSILVATEGCSSEGGSGGSDLSCVHRGGGQGGGGCSYRSEGPPTLLRSLPLEQDSKGTYPVGIVVSTDCGSAHQE